MDAPALQPQLRRSCALAGCWALLGGWLLGCASPGAPRPPSLGLPALAQDLSAVRAGDDVELHFTVPDRTSDDLPLRSSPLRAVLCREQSPPKTCVEVPSAEFAEEGGKALRPGQSVSLRDALPTAFREGVVRPIGYRLQLRNQEGRSAGYSPAVYVLAGPAPPPVDQLVAQGTRAGVVLTWSPVAGGGEVLLRRQQIEPSPVPLPSRVQPAHAGQRRRSKDDRGQHGAPTSAQPGLVWLQAAPGDRSAARTLDSSALEGVRYRYTAIRRDQVSVAGHDLELRSAPSAAVEYTWKDIYPVSAPRGLTAIGFVASGGASSTGQGAFAVDLVWEPVSDQRLGGYLVRRTSLSPDGSMAGEPVQLTPEPLRSPGYHDATAQKTTSYRYEVIAVDVNGSNASAAATATVQVAAP